MSIEEAVSLTLQAAIMMKGGETFILKMESLQLADLLKAFHEYAAQINAKSPDILVVGKDLAKSFTRSSHFRTKQMHCLNMNNFMPFYRDHICTLSFKKST